MALTSRRRTTLALAALAVPVVVVVGALGLRAASGASAEVEALREGVSAVADGIALSGGPDVFHADGATGGAGRPMDVGSAEAPAPGETFDVTVVCTSVDGTASRLTASVEGEVVAEQDVECADGSETGAEPVVSNIPDVPLAADWVIEVAGDSPAAVAVVVVAM